MGKKKKNKKNSASGKVNPSNSADIDKSIDKLETTVLESNFPVSDENSNTFDLLKKIKNKLSGEDEKKIHSILDQCNKLLEEVKKFHNQIEQNRNVAATARKDAEKEQEKVFDERKELEKEQDDLESKKRESNKRLEDIIKRETDADSGFLEKEGKFLSSLEKTKKSLLDKCSELQNRIVESDYNRDLEKQKELLDEIIRQQISLEKESGVIVTRKEKIDLKEALLKERMGNIEKVVEDERQRIQERWNNKIVEINELNEGLKEENDKLRRQINDFESIRSQLQGRSAEEVNLLIKELEDKYTELSIKCERSGGLDLQKRYEAQSIEMDDLKDEIYTITCQLNEAKQRESSYDFSQFEKEQVKRENEQLKTHTALLDEGLNQIKLELDDLKQKNQNRPVFTELIKLDEKYSRTKRIIGRDADESLSDFVKALRHNMGQHGYDYSKETLILFVGGLAMSRLIILDGISGTGKTSLATLFAEVVGGEGTHHDVAVQAGWRDNQDLLGYYNAFERKFYEKEFTIGLYKSITPAFKERPFVILLDEMNLSHVEYYFADMLSELEKQDKGKPLGIRIASGLSKSSKTPEYFDPDNLERLLIPQNVWFIGTANHDETTMGFADKTYDRSHIMTLPRRRHQGLSFVPEAGYNSNWSFDDLNNAFEEAGKKHSIKAERILKSMEKDLAEILDEKFEVSWGNRLERQMKMFVPVVIAAGGTEGLALDHILTSKVLRKGKVVGRFDTVKDDLTELKEIVKILLIQYNISEKNSHAINILEKDIIRKEKGL